MERQKCFVNGHCCYECPDFDRQMVDEKFGPGIADDMGLKEIRCKECYLNTGECKDCLFENSPNCAKYGRDKKMISLRQKQFLAKLTALLDEYHISDVLINDDKISFISCNNELRFWRYDNGTYTMVSTIDNHGNLEENDYNDGGGIC